MMTLRMDKPTIRLGRIKEHLQRQLDEGGTLYGYRSDGKYVARTSAGDRILQPGEDGIGRTVRTPDVDIELGR